MSASSITEERRAFLQRRTARYGLVLGLLGGSFWLVRLVQYVVGGENNPMLVRGMLGHLLGAAFMLLLYAVLRSGRRSERTIHLTELVLLALSCASYGAMATTIPLVFQPDTTIVLVFTTLLLTRSIWVPSDWRWTMALAVTLGVIVFGIVHSAYAEPSERFVALFRQSATRSSSVQASFAINALSWWTLIAVLASSASHVIHGLRREADKVRQLGQYTLTRKIGAGAVGIVYEAKHALLRRPTAVKLLQPGRIDAASLARFEREVHATAALQHPNVVTVFDYGHTPDGLFYYAMELVQGATLTEIVDLDGPQPPARVMTLMHQMASGLAGAHGRGLVHRDIKPDNVLVAAVEGYGELAKLADFGLVLEESGPASRITQDQGIVGTPQYLAPEVIRGEEPGPSCDLYALGALGFFLLTGEHVFLGRSIVEVCSKHLTEPPDAPSERLGRPLPRELEALILRLLRKDPADRPRSAEEVKAELEAMPGFGRWSATDALRWWRDLDPDLRLSTPNREQSLDTRAIAVDLGRLG
jgi:hypothetical protein